MVMNLWQQANKYLVGGVNSPVRAFGPVGGNPVFIAKAKGSKVWDVEGQQYIDYVGSWGALIAGHAHPKIIAAASAALKKGSSFGAPTEAETELAQEICQAFPSIQKVRLVSSGTEAVMGAINVARVYSGRKQVITFKGCYHGWILSADTNKKILPYNDLEAVSKVIKKEHKQIGAIIVEPVAGNMGVKAPKPEFLKGLRRLADRFKIVLIFDEIITGFRIAYGGAQEYFGIKADLTCLGKVIGGGFPIAAYGGKKEVMDLVAPKGSVYQAGTLSGNPVAVAAGLATLKILSSKGVYVKLEERTKELCLGMKKPFSQIGSMFSFVFGSENEFRRFFWKLLRQGIYFAPSASEANFISLAHSDRDIKETIKKGGAL